MPHRWSCLPLVLVSCVVAAPLAAQDMPLSDVLIPGEEWKLVAEGLHGAVSTASDSKGNVYFNDKLERRVHRVDAATGAVSEHFKTPADVWEIAVGPDDRVYASQSELKGLKITTHAILVRTAEGQLETALTCPELAHLCAYTVARDGAIWFTTDDPQAVFVAPPGKAVQRVAQPNLPQPQGIFLWPDQGTLLVSDATRLWVRAFRVEKDRTLTAGADYYGPLQLTTDSRVTAALDARARGLRRSGHVDVDSELTVTPEASAMTMDNVGRLYVCTKAGVQMFDPTGRLGGSILVPKGSEQPHGVCFGGPDRKSLFIVTETKVYRRKLK